MTMYVRTTRGDWAPHKDTPTGKTRTGRQLYTLEEALESGYELPKKESKPDQKSGQHITLDFESRPATFDGATLFLGTLTVDGATEDITFSMLPSSRSNSYRTLNPKTGEVSAEYTVTRLIVKGSQWKVETFGDVVDSSFNNVNDARNPLRNSLQLLQNNDKVRSVHMDDHLFLVQNELEALAPETKTIVRNGVERTVRVAPAYVPKNIPNGADGATSWLQIWFDRRIDRSGNQRSLYAFYQEWKNNRFDGDTAAFEALRNWAVVDSHLSKIGEAHREKWKNKRNDLYKKFAFKVMSMARDGGSITLKRKPKKAVGAKPKKAKPVEVSDEQQSRMLNRASNVALSTLLSYIEACCEREGFDFDQPPKKRNSEWSARG